MGGEDKKKGRVCVTGGTGFIGSWTIKKLLEDGYYVNATTRIDPGFSLFSNNNIIKSEYSVLDFE